LEYSKRMGSVDTLSQSAPASPSKKQRRRTFKERRDIVEETLVPGASVARAARRHQVNANQVFYWRELYREGRLGYEPLFVVNRGGC
jgi:transposase-like protein